MVVGQLSATAPQGETTALAESEGVRRRRCRQGWTTRLAMLRSRRCSECTSQEKESQKRSWTSSRPSTQLRRWESCFHSWTHTFFLQVCVTAVTYHSLVGTLVILFLLLLVLAVVAGIGFKRARMIGMKNQLADANSLSSTAYLAEASQSQFTSRAQVPQVSRTNSPCSSQSSMQARYPVGVLQQQRYLPPNSSTNTSSHIEEPLSAFGPPRRAFQDPSEPIYTDPSLFER